MKTARYFLAEESSDCDVIHSLTQRLSIVRETSKSEKLTFFDTFDWRLYSASLLLYRLANNYILHDLSQDTVLQQQPVETQPRFVWELPNGTLKAKLEPIIEMRALIKLIQVEANSTSYRVLNNDEKTVVRLEDSWFDPLKDEAMSPITRYLSLKPVKGYPNRWQQVKHHLLDLGYQPSPQNVFLDVIALSDRRPGNYSTKLKIELEPNMAAAEATKIILRFLLNVIRQNETGIKEDIDTEFLHDFRVAVRRTRSALSQIKDVFSEAQTVRFKQDFAYIGRLTNELRDLDVYLLAEDHYKAMLPDNLRSDIAPLMTYLKQKRAIALKQVIKGLNSEKYTAILQEWDVFLRQPSDEAPQANTPIIDLAKERIYKKYRRIVKQGHKILNKMQDEQLHDLRIEAKKLRYLMEFFEKLFPRASMATSIKQLKKLQNNLGDFNDLCVQEEYLQNIVAEMPLDQESKKVFLAIGCLIGTLDQERVRVKAEFADTFAQFTTPANKKLFKNLFAV